jgi:hypothetical protein
MTEAQLAALDERLRERRSSSIEAGRSMWARRVARPHRRRQGVVLLAATIALVAATSVMTFSAPDPAKQAAEGAANLAAEERVRDDLGLRFADRCVGVAEARTTIRGRLDALGFADWVIETRDGAENSRCVTAAPAGDSRAVYLIPSMGGDVAKAIDQVAGELMRQCLGKEKALAFVAAALRNTGATRWSIRTDGPLMTPIGQEDAVLKHIADGCFVYSGSQTESDGSRVFYIVGP